MKLYWLTKRQLLVSRAGADGQLCELLGLAYSSKLNQYDFTGSDHRHFWSAVCFWGEKQWERTCAAGPTAAAGCRNWMEFPTVSLVGCLQQGRPHGVHSVLQHVLPVHSLGAQRKLPVLGSNAKGLVFSQGCQKSVLGDSGSVLMSREAALGSPQKETQRNRSKSEEERGG